MRASFRLGRIAGIDIGVHYTWLFAFAIVAWTLAEGFFPTYYPRWARSSYWITGILAALFLFASVLVHELAHSFVARALGLPVSGITLFIFGGVSNLSGEAKKARDEFAIAIVGPLTSVVLAGLFWGLYQANKGSATPVVAILRYLGLVNGLLAVFNLIPGFPLDGGRVLRSILWGTTGSLVRATNIAAGIGQLFGWVLIGWGVFQILQNQWLNGLWIAFVGWFLNSAAEASRKDVAAQEMFRGVTVGEVMDSQPETVTPRTSVEEIVRESFLRRGRRAVPVSEDGNLLGIVTLTDVKELPQRQWPYTVAGDIMTKPPLHTVSPNDDLSEALRKLAAHSLNQVLVTLEGKLVGMLSRADVIRYIQGLQELGISPRAKAAKRQEPRTV